MRDKKKIIDRCCNTVYVLIDVCQRTETKNYKNAHLDLSHKKISTNSTIQKMTNLKKGSEY